MRLEKWIVELLTVLSIVSIVGPVDRIAWSQSNAAVSDHDEIRAYTLPNAKADDDALSNHRTIQRALIKIDETLTIEVSERPTSVDNFDTFVTTRGVNRKPQVYYVGRMIGDKALRLVHGALLRSDSHSGMLSGMLVLEFEGGSVGAREGFAILRYGPEWVQLHVLPLSDYGKVVVFPDRQDLAEVWSGDCASMPPGSAGCGYRKRLCTWSSTGYTCSKWSVVKGLFKISDTGIEIRQAQ